MLRGKQERDNLPLLLPFRDVSLRHSPDERFTLLPQGWIL